MKNRFKKMFAVLTAVLMLLCILPAGIFAEGDEIPIDAEHFPDENFRSYVSGKDTDGNGSLSPAEIAAVTSIDVFGKSIADLTGIGYFTALTKLNCDYNQLTQLDVTQNTALQNLDCSANKLTQLDVSKNTALTNLWCYSNQLTQLDVSKNTALTNLSCNDNQLTELDVTQNTALTDLSCGWNQLTELDVSKNTALTALDCHWNQLTSLDVSKNTALTQFYCFGNQLTQLDVSKNTALKYLWCYDNQLTALNVSKNTALTWLKCYNNQLTSLDVSKNTALTYLDCQCNQLTQLDVSKNTALTYLNCYNNQLTQLDLSNNTALWNLHCGNNRLTSLDLSANTNLAKLECTGNQYKVSSNPLDLTTLPGNFDVTKASSWNGGDVSGNMLTFDEGSETVTYTYDCGNGHSAEFTLLLVPATITFIDGYTGEEIEGSYTVPEGAVLDSEDFPEPPEHYGYHFTDWDYDGSPICEDTEITAQYEINTYYVHFIDNLTGEELYVVPGEVMEVRHGDYINEFPDVPEHEGYRFAQWYNGYDGNDAGWNPIRGNYDGQSIYIYAVYDVEITFCDWNGIPFATKYIYWYNSSAYIYPPAAPEHNGYEFTGWSPEFYNRHYYYEGPKTYIAQYEFNHPADPDIIFKTNTVYTKPDTDVTIDFTVEALKPYECHAFTGFLYYEPSELTLIGDELIKGEVWQQIEALGGFVVVDTTVPGKIGLTVIMPNAGFDMSGTIFSMNFHLEKYHNWQGYTSPLFIEIAKCSNHPVGGAGTPIVYDIENGSVNIYDMTFGDVNWDGKIDTTDVILIMRYALEVQDLTGKYLAAADFNHDGIVNATDALLIMRYIMN